MDFGLSLAVPRVVDGLLKEHLSLLLRPDAVGLCEGERPLIHLPCGAAAPHWLYWPHTSDLPVAPFCLQATSCQLQISYPSLLPGSGMSISSMGFLTAVFASVCWECAAEGWRGCLEESPSVAACGLVWGQLCHLQGQEINCHQCEFKKER